MVLLWVVGARKFITITTTMMLRLAPMRPGARLVAGSLRTGSWVGPAPLRLSPALIITPRRFNSNITNQLENISVAEPASQLLSDTVGYLQSVGLAQGWGVTAQVEQLLEYCHVYTGLPWWGTIVATTVFFRVLLFPLYVKLSGNMARMAKVKPELDECLNEIKTLENNMDRNKALLRRKQIMKDNNVSTLLTLVPMAQFPVAYGFFQALRKMAAHPVDGFDTQGAYWFTDLTQVDPYIGLQGISALLVTVLMKLGGETGNNAVSPMIKRYLYVIPVVTMLITKNFSAAVAVYLAANSACSFVQALILRLGPFRRLMKLPPRQPTPPNPNQPKSILEWWRNMQEKLAQENKKNMAKANKKLEAKHRRKDAASDGFIRRH